MKPTTPTANWQRVVVVTYAVFTAAGAVLFLLAAVEGRTQVMTSIAQASLWFAIAVALLRKDRRAPTLLWWLVALSALGTVIRGLIPSEILALGLNLWFAVWYRRAVKPCTQQAHVPDQQHATELSV
jgi:predicted metal-dependent hydrolase